jgi:bifunctional non-homologous end joining protein LigD
MARRTLPKSKRQYVKVRYAAIEASGLKQALKAPMPRFIEPALATLVEKPPSTEHWVHEIKFDGYRLQMHVQQQQAKLYTRRGHDWTDRFKSIADSAWWLETSAAVLDGEVVVQAPDGTTDFGALEADLGEGRDDHFVYFVFDLLYLDGFDLRRVALLERKRVLKVLMESAKPPIWYIEHTGGDAQALYEDACKRGIEGLVSKRADGIYQSGRTQNWTKVTCRNRDTFYAIGIATKNRKFDGVYLARTDGDELLYAGKVERGFSEQQVQELKSRLEPYKVRTQPLSAKVEKPKATWFKPAVLIDVEYRALTGKRKVRHPSYKGIREDLIGAVRSLSSESTFRLFEGFCKLWAFM